MRTVDPKSEFSVVHRYLQEAGKPVSLSEIEKGTGISQKKISRILYDFFNRRKILSREGKPRYYRYSLKTGEKK